jgi:hypothetical protein
MLSRSLTPWTTDVAIAAEPAATTAWTTADGAEELLTATTTQPTPAEPGIPTETLAEPDVPVEREE